MNGNRVFAPAILLCVNILLWQGCTGDRIAGGSSETENTVTARAFRVDSLLSSWNRPVGVPTVATLRLDSTNFDFQNSNPQGLDLDVRREDGARIPFEIRLWDTARRQGRLNVRIDTDMRDSGAMIWLWRSLPPIDRSNSAGVWFGVPDTLRLALTSVLVDDFEDGNTRTLLPDSSNWFLAAGSQIVNADGGRSGKALYLVSSATGPVAMAAALLASTPRRLGSIDSIVFWARGTGRLRVAMEHALPGSELVAWTPYDLDTAWQRVSILPTFFDSTGADSGGARWEEIQDSVTHLSFWSDGAVEVWIDDPRIYGVNRDDLF